MKRRRRNRKNRRGALLLVVLSLLMLFTLISITFIAQSGQARKGAISSNRAEANRPDPPALLREAMLQMLRGTNNPNSGMLGHDLLADMYGNSMVGTLGSVQAVPGTGNQIYRLRFSGSLPAQRVNPTPDDYFRGCVLTMISGQAAGESTRVTASDSDSVDILTFRKMAPDGSGPVVPQGSDRFVLNGREFDAVRYIVNGGNRQLRGGTNAAEDLFVNFSTVAWEKGGLGNILPRLEDLDESYDAVDFKNMLLAKVVPNPNPQNPIIPSLHRPSLIRKLGASDPAMLQRIMLRPLPTDKQGSPNLGIRDYTGKIFDPVNGPWDVDNDGDGVLDSVWVDLGFPVMTAPDGRTYKPLFAVMCVDQDGRANANTHGGSVQTQQTYYDGIRTYWAGGANGGRTSRYVSVGSGVGPAEINLRFLGLTIDQYRELLEGNGTWPGRYGGGGSTPGQAGTNTDNHRLSLLNRLGMPGMYNPSDPDPLRTGSYGTPPDLRGALFLGLDPAGQLTYRERTSRVDELIHNPYKMNPFRLIGVATTGAGAAADNAFTYAELERVLRRYDRDASRLPRRLLELIQNANNPRHDVTVASFDHPARSAQGVVDLVYQRVSGNNKIGWMRANLPPEMLAGLPMDLNRPLGNGRDDDGDGYIDEPDEISQEANFVDENRDQRDDVFTDVTSAIRFDLNQDGQYTPNTDKFARQKYAHYLYVLAMLVKDPSFQYFGDANATARVLAQWAVNVVDFYDRDSVMTPLVYDPSPFSSTRGLPDQTNLQTPNVVWGCERPDLLLTESIAWHDQRKETLPDKNDLKTEQSPKQTRRPSGNLVIELFHPGNPLHARQPELYGTSTGLELHRQSQNPGTKSPVWRMAFTPSGASVSSSSIVLGTAASNPIDFVAYFTAKANVADEFSNQGQSVTDRKRFFTNGASSVMEPNSYAVVGSAEKMYLGRRQREFRNKAAEDPAAAENEYPAEIELKPGAGNDQVIVNRGNTRANDDAGLKETLGIVMLPQEVNNRKRRFSVSEPENGYDAFPNPNNTPGGDTADDGFYAEASYRAPVDAAPSPAATDGYKNTVKRVYLQRLANPLEAWNEYTNPYVIVDQLDVDLSVYSGEQDRKWVDPQTLTQQEQQDLDWYIGDDTLGKATHLDTRRRGKTNGAATDNTRGVVWFQESMPPKAAPDESNPLSDDQTLGYLNKEYGDPITSGTYAGSPKDGPFPWLTWNDRPFVSQAELMLVPWTNQAQRLTTQFGFNVHQRYASPPQPAYNGYQPTQPTALAAFAYRHLLNFFHTGTGDSPRLYRLLELTHVPSPFVGTRTWLNPMEFSSSSNSATTIFMPPFNWLSNYRDPGRINLNTIFSRDVFYALMNEHADGGVGDNDFATDLFWQKFQASRRGSNTPNDPNLPTAFGNPFRSSSDADQVPVPELARQGSEVGLLRPSQPAPLSAGSGTSDPLFALPLPATPSSQDAVDNPVRNPYFRYRQIQRLANLTTNRSNVYAVWITVGFFEVESVASPSVYQKDGYRLVRELGSDTGEVRRHRAFFMIDRSIPVAYQRGRNHNVHNAVVLERFIE